MAYEWQSDIIRPDGENGTEVLDGQGVYQPQIEGGDNITIENGRINASGTLENVQANYTETDPSDPSYIKNKPDLSIYATASGMETELAGKQDVISDLETIRSGAEAGSTAVQPGDLAQVATTGSYTSLSNTPQNIVQDASYVHTDNNFSNADKSKLDGIAAGAEVNVQPDWDEADSSSDAFIKNKPTIPAAQINSDWNAVSGVSQILNKPDLSAYATDTELSDGLATKQNVISDLDTIRAGAAAGATAAQPSDLPSSDELVPSASSGDAGKVLTVDNQGNPGWVTPSAGTVYTPGDGIGITNDVISADVDGVTIGIDSTTKKIKSLQTIPTKTSDLQNDSNFVVASSLATVATSGSYADLSGKPTIPSVDQTYNASSTNAQSGTAVAQAIASIPSSSYTAGDGIEIDNGEISVDHDNTLSVTRSYGAASTLEPLSSTTSVVQTSSDFKGWVANGSAGEYLRVSIPANAFNSYTTDTGTAYLGISDDTSVAFYPIQLSATDIGNDVLLYDAQTIELPLPVGSSTGWGGSVNLTATNLRLIIAKVDSGSFVGFATYYQNTPQSMQVAKSIPGGAIAVSNPLPASDQADSGKVLKVNASGNAEWGTDSDTTYTAGNMIAINANNSNAIGVSTTAGITDIQQVAALPANPVATVLYLIPET